MRSHFLYSLIGVLLAAESLLAVPTPPKRQVRFLDEQDPASASYAQGGQSSQPQYPVAPQGGQSSLNPQIPDSGPSSQAGLGGQQHRPLSPFPEFADLFRQNPPPAGQPAPAVPERRLGSPIQFSSNPQGQSAVRSAYPVPGTSSHRPLSPVRPSFSPHIQDPGPSNQAASGTHGRRPLSPTLPTSESPGRNTATPGRTTSGSQRQASTSSDSSSFSFQAPQDGPWPELTNIEERWAPRIAEMEIGSNPPRQPIVPAHTYFHGVPSDYTVRWWPHAVYPTPTEILELLASMEEEELHARREAEYRQTVMGGLRRMLEDTARSEGAGGAGSSANNQQAQRPAPGHRATTGSRAGHFTSSGQQAAPRFQRPHSRIHTGVTPTPDQPPLLPTSATATRSSNLVSSAGRPFSPRPSGLAFTSLMSVAAPTPSQSPTPVSSFPAPPPAPRPTPARLAIP